MSMFGNKRELNGDHQEEVLAGSRPDQYLEESKQEDP